MVSRDYRAGEYVKTAESVQRLIRAYKGKDTGVSETTAKGALLGAAMGAPLGIPFLVLNSIAGGLSDRAVLTGVGMVPILGGAIIGGVVSRKFKQNQNRMLATAKYHPERIRSGEVKRPLHPAAVLSYGPHAYGLYNKTRQVYDYIKTH